MSSLEERAPRAVAQSGTVAAIPDPAVSARRARRLEWFQAVALLSLCVLVFLWKPLTSGGYYAPGDLSQAAQVLRTTPPNSQVSNAVLGDVTNDILPWQVWNADQIRQGKLPLWNPYNGSGVPHLANGQAAPFSLFNLPFYVFSIRVALLVSAAMILMISGLLTYGLARYLRIGHLGSVAASIGFAFAGINIVWLRWPIVAAAALLPGIVWMACVVIDAEVTRRRLSGAVGLAATVAVGLLSGHPETTFYALAGSAVFVIFRLLAKRVDLKRSVGRLAALAGSVILGVCLAAVQILPTLEYVAHRAPSGDRQAFADKEIAGLLAFPFLEGSPFGRQRARILPIAVPYTKGVGMYIAAGFMLLGLVGFVSLVRRRKRIGTALAALGVAWLLFIFDIGGFGRLITRLPGIKLAMALRSIPLWALAISLLCGMGVDVTRQSARARSRTPASRRVLLEVLGATLVLTVVGIASFAQLGRTMPKVAGVAARTASSPAREHVAFVIGWFLIAVAAIVAPILLARRRRGAGIGRALELTSAAVLLVALFASSGFLWRGWNPTVSGSKFYARSNALDRIQEVVGDAQTLRLDASAIPPDINLVYRVRSPETYDAIGVDDYNALYRRLLHPPSVVFDGTSIGILGGPVRPAGLGNLRVLGIRYVTTRRNYPFATRALAGSAIASSDLETSQFAFRPAPGGPATVSELVLRSSAIPAASRCRVVLQRRGSLLSPPWLGLCGAPGVAVALPKPVAVGAGFVVALSVTATQGRTATPVPTASVTVANTAVAGLALVADVEGYRVYRVPGAPAHVFSPAGTVRSSRSDGSIANASLDAPDAQPALVSVVDARDGRSDGVDPGVIDVTRNDAGDIRFRVTRTTPGWVVVMESFYPGWKASVDGHDVAVRRANDAFLAVRVPAGSTSVRLSYAPDSVRFGLALSVGTAALLVLALAVCWRSARRRAHRASTTAAARTE